MNPAGENQIVELNRISDKVAMILEKYPKARDDDKLLTVMVLKEFYHVRFIDDIMLPGVPSLESIRRIRQKLQQEGIYMPLEVTASIRENQEEIFRSFVRRDL